MGMFDDLLCEHELPDGFDPTGVSFQTKDTPAQWMERYVIRADGRLIHQKSGQDVEPHGAIEFYGGNWCGSSGDLYMTSDDQPPWSAEYTALYDHGKLIRIEGEKGPVEGVTHVLRADFTRLSAERRDHGLSAHDIAARDLCSEWRSWMDGPYSASVFERAMRNVLSLRLEYLWHNGAWPGIASDAKNLRNWSDWLLQQDDLPPDAAELLEKTRKFLAETAA